NTLIIGGVVGGILLIGVVAFAMMSGKSDKPAKADSFESTDKKKKKADSPASSSTRPPDKSSSSSSFTAAPSVPAGTFQPGARGQVGDVNVNREVQNSGVKQQYDAMAGAGKVADIVAQ